MFTTQGGTGTGATPFQSASMGPSGPLHSPHNNSPLNTSSSTPTNNSNSSNDRPRPYSPSTPPSSSSSVKRTIHSPTVQGRASPLSLEPGKGVSRGGGASAVGAPPTRPNTICVSSTASFLHSSSPMPSPLICTARKLELTPRRGSLPQPGTPVPLFTDSVHLQQQHPTPPSKLTKPNTRVCSIPLGRSTAFTLYTSSSPLKIAVIVEHGSIGTLQGQFWRLWQCFKGSCLPVSHYYTTTAMSTLCEIVEVLVVIVCAVA